MKPTSLLASEPMQHIGRDEILDGYSIGTHQQLAMNLELLGESIHAGELAAAGGALHFDRHDFGTFDQYKIDFAVTGGPVVDVHLRALGGIHQPHANGGFDQSPPGLAIVTGFFQRQFSLSGDQRIVVDLKFRTRTTLPDLLAGILAQPNTGQARNCTRKGTHSQHQVENTGPAGRDL